jgi:predicted peptidase
LTIRKSTRREALKLCGAGLVAAFAGRAFSIGRRSIVYRDTAPGPALSPGTPNSAERLALITDFRKQSDGLQDKFEARTYKSDWTMPYRLYRPVASGKLPLILYLSGSGGLGDDNLKQIGLGNIFGTRVWLLPENQRQFPCFVVAPQTDRGWAKYEFSQQDGGGPKPVPGLGDGSRLALEIIDSLRREFPIDERRIYVAGQSMGGAGVWNVIAARPRFFAAGIICCGSSSTENGTEGIETPLWVFQGDADKTVPVSLSRDRIAARRKAGGHPLYTEYAGVDHNCWEWAFTEPALVNWLAAQRRS